MSPSRQREFRSPLPGPGEFLRVRITTRMGDVVAFTIQYETTIDERSVPVVLYDSAHGTPHRDVLDRRGNVIDRTWFPGRSNKEALQLGDADLRTNWQRYKAAFMETADERPR